MPIVSYDVIIVGGGLAGLSAGILLCKNGYKVLLAEKETYPRHKVCGEYISKESLPYLQLLCPQTDFSQYPSIHKLKLTTTTKVLNAALALGGIGMSRYELDAQLATSFKAAGGILLEASRVEQVQYEKDRFSVKIIDTLYEAPVVLGAWGKRSNIDISKARTFIDERHRRLSNFVGIKYHVLYDVPKDEIGLHIFDGGYCGISAVENNRCCLCYLVSATSLKQHGSVAALEKAVLFRNPSLKKIFNEAQFIYDRPLSISQISFEPKSLVEDHILCMGDAAGLITPLSGNGMSIALRSGILAAQATHHFLKGQVSRREMEQAYEQKWLYHFKGRMRQSRWLQQNFFSEKKMSMLIKVCRIIPKLTSLIISRTHGHPY